MRKCKSVQQLGKTEKFSESNPLRTWVLITLSIISLQSTTNQSMANVCVEGYAGWDCHPEAPQLPKTSHLPHHCRQQRHPLLSFISRLCSPEQYEQCSRLRGNSQYRKLKVRIGRKVRGIWHDLALGRQKVTKKQAYHNALSTEYHKLPRKTV